MTIDETYYTQTAIAPSIVRLEESALGAIGGRIATLIELWFTYLVLLVY